MSSDDTIVISLTKGQSTIINASRRHLGQFHWQAHKSKNDNTYYAQRRETFIKDGHRKYYSLHRVIFEEIIGRPLEKHERVDHVDGDGLNNVDSNLRLSTHQQNSWNQRKKKNNKSGYKNVAFYKATKKWAAYIQVDRKRKHLGYFDTPELAYQAYCDAAREHYGEFARLE